MSALDELRDAILDNAKGPRRVSSDEGTVEQHSIPDQLKALEQADAKRAAKPPYIRYCQIVREPR